MEEKQLTVRDLVALVANLKKFPKGLDTVITSGDYEGNTHCTKHTIFTDKIGKEKCLMLGHELWGEDR